jgi:alpha-beta hydrolase superfamily lysophospholipase/SAM-dependent methyltransferase
MAPIEQSFKTWDGVELFYRAWLPQSPCDRALILFHRGHEHSGRWQEVVDNLALENAAAFAWDARGHGRSPGERGAAPNLLALIKDTDAFVRHIAVKYGVAVENMVVLAHSVGAVTAAAWVHDYAPPIRAMILATPAFRVRLYVPLAIPALRLKRRGSVKSYVKGGMLTHDSAEAARYDADPLIFQTIAVNVLLDLHDTGRRLLADAGAINVPTLMLVAGHDWVVSLKAQRQFYHGLSSPVKRMHEFPAMSHSVFHESDRMRVIERMRAFIQERFAEKSLPVSLREADRYGYTWEEHERLKLTGSPRFALARLGLRAARRFSNGIDLGWRSGFDSGATLDYVYENKPRGFSGLGRAIDAGYLNSIGWRGIRQRRLNLTAALRRIMESIHAEGGPLRILDVAAGGGRYVLETLKALPGVPAQARLRDEKQENVEAIRRLAKSFGLTNVEAEIGDAFDRAALADLEPKPTIAIVSGLHELFPSNTRVRQSLAGLAEALEPGGYLIYTNQPWHPQLEFIARVLPNREGRPWIMRRRTTAEMDELVRQAGFEKTGMEIDRWGMFSVSVAQRSAR